MIGVHVRSRGRAGAGNASTVGAVEEQKLGAARGSTSTPRASARVSVDMKPQRQAAKPMDKAIGIAESSRILMKGQGGLQVFNFFGEPTWSPLRDCYNVGF